MESERSVVCWQHVGWLGGLDGERMVACSECAVVGEDLMVRKAVKRTGGGGFKELWSDPGCSDPVSWPMKAGSH